LTKSLRFVIGSLELGGTEKHLAQVLPELSDRGWDITVILLTDKARLAPALVAAGIKIYKFNLYSSLVKLPGLLRKLSLLTATCFYLWQKLRQEPHTTTHFFLPTAYILGMAVKFVTRLPFTAIMSRRSLNYYQQNIPFAGAVERFFHKRVDYVLANSERILVQLRKEEGLSADRSGLIYNGINLDYFLAVNEQQQSKANLGIEDHLVFGIVANLIAYKGHKDLLDALSMCKHLPNKWCLLCIGDDRGIGNALKEQAESLGINDNIKWLGSKDNVPELLAACDIGLLVSHEEGFSNAILEGMAAGLPMIVTDVGGNSESVQHMVTGLVVPAKQPPALSSAIDKLSSDVTLRQKLGLAGKNRVHKEFSLQSCVDSYNSFYETIECAV